MHNEEEYITCMIGPVIDQVSFVATLEHHSRRWVGALCSKGVCKIIPLGESWDCVCVGKGVGGWVHVCVRENREVWSSNVKKTNHKNGYQRSKL